ncbi:uncharacterized mitochondrial protein AtMg00810-like [Lycium barbarum]|uniref:uncharacterized mitochondrial protein AtMg00810-like n=1 Tax=Lycium barbarum TaxID=112863 RepID=UPI00293E0980|nr:uncharacterized mitochondrial protein AtMg00810-like [Lycium barbarum]
MGLNKHQGLGINDLLTLFLPLVLLIANTLRCSIMDLIGSEFDMKDLGPLNYFLGIAVTRHKGGALQYLTFTRLDISYAVQQGTLDHGLHLYPSSVTDLVSYTDADWGGCPDTRRSTSGYCLLEEEEVEVLVVKETAKEPAKISHGKVND